MDSLDRPWFLDWLERAWPLTYRALGSITTLLPALQLLGAGGVMAAALALLTWPDLNHGRTYFFFVNDIGHLVVLSLLTFLFLNHLEVGRAVSSAGSNEPTARTVAWFKHSLYLLIWLWSGLFLTRSVLDLPPEIVEGPFLAKPSAISLELVSRIFNILTTVGFFGMYVTLSRLDPSTRHISLTERVWGIALLVLGGIILELYAHLGGTDSEAPKTVAGVCNGLIVGFSMCLLIGRLDSRYLGVPAPIIKALYGYALIQSLLPFVFASGTSENTSPATPAIYLTPERMIFLFQQFVIFSALILKATFIVSVGKLIDTGSLHFYISNMAWLERHVSKLRAMHDEVRVRDGVSRGGPPLHAFTPVGKDSAVLRVAQAYIHLPLTIVNSWIGIDWEATEIRVERLTVGTTAISVNKVRFHAKDGVRILGDQRFTECEIFIDLAHDPTSLRTALLKDPQIDEATTAGRESELVEIGLFRIEIRSAISDLPDARYRWQSIVPLGGAAALFYRCPLDLATLMEQASGSLVSAPAVAKHDASVAVDRPD